MSSPAFVVMSRRSLGLCSEHWRIFPRIRPVWQPIAILTPAPGMAQRRTFPVGCVGLRGKNFRSSRSIAHISAVQCAGSKSPLCLCVPATAAFIMKMALVLPARRRAGSTNMNTRLSRHNCGCAAGSCRLYRNRCDAGQVAEKDSYASFHSTDSLQFVFVVVLVQISPSRFTDTITRTVRLASEIFLSNLQERVSAHMSAAEKRNLGC